MVSCFVDFVCIVTAEIVVELCVSTGSPDSRYVRVETCMFMIKLPQYSSEELMRRRLLYAIHCRDDPLSG